MIATSFALRLPSWIESELSTPRDYARLEQRMALAIRLAELNVRHGSGGPFGAAVFDRREGTLLGVGVNVVVTSGYSLAHAEMVAIALAQQTCGTFDLGGAAQPELVSSAEPCAMCLGAIAWSGVSHLACAARGTDVEAIGFDEGPKPADWPQALRQRGITVSVDIGRAEAVAVLERYRTDAGAIYNPANPRQR